MSSEVLVAIIATAPPTLGVVLSYLASKRALRRSVGGNPGVPLRKVLTRMETRTETRFDRLEIKVDRIVDGQARMRERLAGLEANRTGGGTLDRRSPPDDRGRDSGATTSNVSAPS